MHVGLSNQSTYSISPSPLIMETIIRVTRNLTFLSLASIPPRRCRRSLTTKREAGVSASSSSSSSSCLLAASERYGQIHCTEEDNEKGHTSSSAVRHVVRHKFNDSIGDCNALFHCQHSIHHIKEDVVESLFPSKLDPVIRHFFYNRGTLFVDLP